MAGCWKGYHTVMRLTCGRSPIVKMRSRYPITVRMMSQQRLRFRVAATLVSRAVTVCTDVQYAK